MDVIKKLAERVEKEHGQYLRDSQRIEDRSAMPINGITTAPTVGGVDFESLVGSGGAATVKADTDIDPSKAWDDDVWGSIFSSAEVRRAYTGLNGNCLTPHLRQPPAMTSPPIPPPAQSQVQTLSVPSTPQMSPAPSSSRPAPVSRSSRGLNTTPAPASSFNSTTFGQTQSRSSLGNPARSSLTTSSPLTLQPPAQPLQGFASAPSNGPNYNISLPPAPIMPSAPMMPGVPLQPTMASMPAVASPPLFATPSVGGVLTPSRPLQSTWPGSNTGSKQLSKDDWGDFDPLA